MDFSTIVNEQGYKYIQSPVIYKFPSQKFLNKKSSFSINAIGNQLFRRQHPNETSNQKLDLQISSKNHIQNEQNKNKNGKGLFQSKNSIDNNKKQYEIHIIPQVKNSTLTDEPLYSKLSKNEELKRQSKIQPQNRRQKNWQRKPSQQFSYYRKYFSPDTIKSTNIPPLSPHNGSSRYSLPRTSINDQLTRYAANQVIYQTQKQLLEKQVSNLKLQLKSYEQKVQQLTQEKQEWIRCKNRNEILQREYKILNQENQRLKDSNLQNLDNKWRSSEVQKIDLKEVSSEDFAKKIMLEKRYSYKLKSMIDQSQFKQQVKGLNDKISQLQNQIYLLKNENHSLKEQNLKLKQTTNYGKQPSVQKQPHKLEQQLIFVKEHNIKLQQQKQSYLSNYKILKNEREKQCKQLKSKQQEIYQSLQKLNKDLLEVKKEKQSIEAENKKLKRKNTELENQMEIISKKYSTIKMDYDQVSNNLHSTQQQQFYKIKNRRTSFEDKYLQLQEQLQQANMSHKQKLNHLLNQKQEQKDQLVKKYQQKINILQNQISQIKNSNRQHLHEIKNYEKDTKIYEKQINQNNQKITRHQAYINELQQKLKTNESKIKDYEQKMKRNERQYQQKLSKLEQTFTSIDGKASRSSQKLRSQQNTIKSQQQKIEKLQKLLQNKQKQIFKRQKEIESLIQKREQKWKQLMDIKQKYMELSETILVHSNEKDNLKSQNFALREKIMQKQTQINLIKKQFDSQINNLNTIITTIHQRQVQLNTANQNTLLLKQNELKKQRVQIQGLLQQVVKLRQVKSQNYKLMQKQKAFMKLDETITHLWAVKQTQYQNITQVLFSAYGQNITTKN